MPSEALGRSQLLAGIPAGLGSLQNLLTVAVDPKPAKQALIDAYELDPALLVAALAINPEAAADLADWHTHIEPPLLQATALTLAGRANTGLLATGDGHWQRAIRLSMLTDELARKVGNLDSENCRLTGLLAGLIEAAPQIAEELKNIGCTDLVCDAIRYQNESAQELAGAAGLLRVVATARRLLGAVGSPDPPADEHIQWLEEVLQLAPDVAYEAVGTASWRYEQVMRAVRKVDTSQTMADAQAGAIFYRALLKSEPGLDFINLITQSARYLFGCSGVCHFHVTDDGALTTSIDGEAVTVRSDDSRSAIAAAHRQQSLVSGVVENATLIEHQLLTRLGGTAFYCVPLSPETGVLFLAAEVERINALKSNGVLLSSFADAANDLLSRTADGGGAVSLDELKARAREITHEVNNPLAIVQNYLRTLALKLEKELGKDHPVLEAVQQEVDAISAELLRVSSLLQKYGRIGDDDALVYEPVDINELISDLVTIVEGVEVETRFDAGIPPIELAADAIRQVIVNLMKNAQEALTDIDHPKITISTQGAVNLGGKHYLEIVISDNGPGIPVEQRLQLFQNGEPSTKGAGRGIGLGIVKSLMDRMQGIVSCREGELEAGEVGGTSFQILIPFETNRHQN